MEVVRNIGVHMPKCGIHDGNLQYVTHFEGNNMTTNSHVYICERLQKLGIRVCVPPYSGHWAYLRTIVLIFHCLTDFSLVKDTWLE